MSSAEMRSIYETAPIGLALLTSDCRYVLVNQRLTEICGIPVADHIGRSVRETVPGVAEQVEELVQAILRTGEPITGIEVHGQRPDKKNVDHVWVTHWHPVKNQAGDVVGINVAAEEITERKRTEAALVASQARQLEVERTLRELNATLSDRVRVQARERDRIWNVSLDLLTVADIDGRIVSVNPAWTETLGWSAEELLGKTAHWIVHPDDLEKGSEERERLIKGQSAQNFENRIRNKQGAYHWVSWRAVRDQDHIYAVGRDVTALRTAEEQVRASRHQLMQASRQMTMGAMTASISHEISQPLTIIVTQARAALRALNRADPDLADVQATLENILSAGNRTADVIASVRSMFGRETREKVLLDVNTVIGEVLALMREDLESQQVIVKCVFANRLPRVRGEPVQLQQVLVNLISNAIDAMNAVSGRERRLSVKSMCNGANVVSIDVGDWGTGIDPNLLEQIFNPFFTTKSHGMGLGLSICRSIIESHGGRLRAVPNDPFGTMFCIEFQGHEADGTSSPEQAPA